jgi:hypothetical protein
MFQILSYKRNGSVSAQSGPEGAAVPNGNDDTPHLETPGAVSSPAIAASRALPGLAFTPRQLSPRQRQHQQALRLAHQARLWFAGPGLRWRATLPPAAQLAVATESLAVTARLIALIARLQHPDSDTSVDCPPLPPGHPLHGSMGGQIAEASRALVRGEE